MLSHAKEAAAIVDEPHKGFLQLSGSSSVPVNMKVISLAKQKRNRDTFNSKTKIIATLKTEGLETEKSLALVWLGFLDILKTPKFTVEEEGPFIHVTFFSDDLINDTTNGIKRDLIP